MNSEKTIENVKEYYGKVLQSKDDLKTSACCTAEAVPDFIKPSLKLIHPEVADRFYGCGAPFPPALEGITVLDLGSGTGRDCFVLSHLVGETGRVVGVDMTDEQISVALKHQDYHREQFGHSKSNVEFHQGYIEDLEGAGIASDSVDLVVSNCVMNLSPDKGRVFREILRVLKPGGELYFSDVFASRRVPGPYQQDPVLVGECLGGALYYEDFRRILFEAGVPDYRIVNRAPIALTSKEVQDKVGNIAFSSVTVRAFKLASLEDRCEDYGQVATYQGSIPGHSKGFILDDHHHFETGRPMLVCGNTAAMVGETRYQKHFKIDGNRDVHFGLFDCGPTPQDASTEGACC